MSIVKHLIDTAKGKHKLSDRRSPQWPEVERAYKKAHPNCAVCGRSGSIQVHHKVPFHVDRSLELDPDNLISLCEPTARTMKCHLIFGHCGNFKLYNPKIGTDAPYWNEKIENAHERRSEE